VPGGGQVAAGERGELRDPLHGDHLARELVEHRGLVARAGADVEHAFSARELERLADERDDEGLRDRLPVREAEGAVGVGEVAVVRRDEELARDAPHRLEHAWVVDAAPCELLVDPVRCHGGAPRRAA
jgi:hypothetical protein